MEVLIYNEEKTKQLLLEDCDLTKGQLIQDTLETIVPEKEEIAEEGHYETIAEYPNGGKDVVWVVDREGQAFEPEKVENIPIQVYVPYSEEYLLQQERTELRKQLEEHLTHSDYKVLKFLEGLISEEEFAAIKKQRQQWRDLINKLEKAFTLDEVEKIKKEKEQYFMVD